LAFLPLLLFLLLGQRASAYTVCSVAKLVFNVCLLCTCFSSHFSAVHSVVTGCGGEIRLVFKLLLKFRTVLKHSEGPSSFAWNQSINEDYPHGVGSFTLKRNET